MRLPNDYFINYFLLFACCATQIDTSGFKAFMPHEVSKKGDVVEPLEKILGKPMTERMWIYNIPIHSVSFSKVFELVGYASCGDAIAEAVEEYITRRDVLIFEPFDSFCPQVLRNIQSAYLATFAIKVEIANLNVLHLDMEQFAYTSTGSSHEPHYKIPGVVSVTLQLSLEELIVCITNHILQKVLLLNFHKLHL